MGGCPGHSSARTFVRDAEYDHPLMPSTAATRARRGRKLGRTREAILDRAVDLASTQGLEGLTIGRLATDLGMSKSGLFGHFGSKEELQLATIQHASQRFVDEVVKPAH